MTRNTLLTCLLFSFLMIKFTVFPKKAIWQLAIWQNWCFGQFYGSPVFPLSSHLMGLPLHFAIRILIEILEEFHKILQLSSKQNH